ncbi:MAG: oligosaccharide flippase family protein [Pseudonocardia sp.]
MQPDRKEDHNVVSDGSVNVVSPDPGRTGPDGGALRSAVVLMTAASTLPPIAGLLSQPILAHSLGVEGRGLLAAALAPAVLIMNGATLGLPEALTYLVAKAPRTTRRALAWALGIGSILGATSLALVFWTAPILAAQDDLLADLMILAAMLVVPAMLVSLLRGAAGGRQMWGAIAVERLIYTVLRLIGLVLLAVLDRLTIGSAIVVTFVPMVVSGVIYWRLIFPVGDHVLNEYPVAPDRVARSLVSYGSRAWIGAVAGIVLAKVGQILMVPLAGAEELGLFVVATTIADLPFLVAVAVREAVFGVSSQTRDADRLARATRLTTFVGLLGCVGLGLTVPLWIGWLFGAEFTVAMIPTLLLLGGTVLGVPGLISSAGLGAWGRPGTRSLGIVLALAVNIAVFVALVPSGGAVGACWAAVASNTVLSAFSVVLAARLTGRPLRDFLVLRRDDYALMRSRVAKLCDRTTSSRSGGQA